MSEHEADFQPEEQGPGTISDEEIITERNLPRRSFLSTSGLLVAGAVGLVSGNRAAAQQDDPDKRPDDKRSPDDQSKPDDKRRPDDQSKPDDRRRPDDQQKPDDRRRPDDQQKPDDKAR